MSYVDRLRTEMEELATRLDKLNTFLNNQPVDVFVNVKERELLVQQANVMNEYLVILNKRVGMKR